MAAIATPRQAMRASDLGSMPSSARSEKAYKNMSVEEMERALTHISKRMPETIRGSCAPQTARSLLEENKQLIEEKRERKARERQNSREFTETLLAKDRRTNEHDKARDIGRKQAQQQLAQYYKTKIAEKETSKASEYSRKVQCGSEIQYFPFVEGENINKSREAQASEQREEMRGFLRRQRDDNPPRVDSLLLDVGFEYPYKYPSMQVGKQQRPRSQDASARASFLDDFASEDVAPHMQRHPRFLSRAREHLSRRLHDNHVRKALEDKVVQTKDELEKEARRRELETQQAMDGMLVNDALRYDSTLAKAADMRRNQAFLRAQMEEKQQKDRGEVYQRQREPAGYWGPEEKPMQSGELIGEHCRDLISQMEVNQRRRVGSRCRRLRQERRLVDNCMAEMSEDRERDRAKAAQQKDVLTTTWKSQKKVKQALDTIEQL
eukprot:TRINITY_DN62808_c0_g1_i1.p1 TRINITY_DN62808_c0_g1~~TRINITY_DN62808_c0_g1_i1.p1  ORF type:complete len:437 (-),score=119.95 TRINITY_DN62808_c0_g1_i1:369-1679(-)